MHAKHPIAMDFASAIESVQSVFVYVVCIFDAIPDTAGERRESPNAKSKKKLIKWYTIHVADDEKRQHQQISNERRKQKKSHLTASILIYVPFIEFSADEKRLHCNRIMLTHSRFIFTHFDCCS